jgi:hypothetical protein
MTTIKVPKPPRSAYDPERPLTSLLKAQIEHLHEAERRLPLRYRTEMYVNAIRTEAEAAEYICDVTEAVHKAHTDAERLRGKRERKLEIAAAAERRSATKSRSNTKKKSKGKGRNAKSRK